MKQAFAWLLIAGCGIESAIAECEPFRTGEEIELYPTAEILPANLLRLYLYLPEPVRDPDALGSIALFDADGQPISNAFLPNRYDLLSPDRKRLTLLLDPGRVKTGLGAHELMGRALARGQSYILKVNWSVWSADCEPDESTLFPLSIGRADFDPPDPSSWVLTPPRASTVLPLTVHLGSAHDHLSLAFRLRIVDPGGNTVPGTIELAEGETVWRFIPTGEWQKVGYKLIIDPRFEDLAGNRPGGNFESPVGSPELSWSHEIAWTPTD